MSEAVDLRRAMFISAVMGYWRQGYDTWWIASRLGEDEAGIERVLHEGMELERKRDAKKDS